MSNYSETKNKIQGKGHNITMVHNFSSLLLVFLLFIAPTYEIPIEQVSSICNQSKRPSFCFALLNSKPKANLVSLTQYTIDTTRTNVTNTIKLINSLIAQSVNDPKAKNHYKSCLEHFKGALYNVDYTQELLKKGDYQGVNVAASSIQTNVDDCISGESPTDPPYHDPSMLPKYASIIELVVEIILIISNSLLR